MKLEMKHEFGWPAEKITAILAAGEELFNMDELPNVSMRKLVESNREGSQLKRKYEWNVHGKIPKIAQKVIKPEMLTFVENTVWDDNTSSFTVKIIPHFLKKKIGFNSTSTWASVGEGKTRRTVVINVKVKIPIVGPPFEKTIADYFKKNNDDSAKMVVKGLTEKFGPENK